MIGKRYSRRRRCWPARSSPSRQLRVASPVRASSNGGICDQPMRHVPLACERITRLHLRPVAKREWVKSGVDGGVAIYFDGTEIDLLHRPIFRKCSKWSFFFSGVNRGLLDMTQPTSGMPPRGKPLSYARKATTLTAVSTRHRGV